MFSRKIIFGSCLLINLACGILPTKTDKSPNLNMDSNTQLKPLSIHTMNPAIQTFHHGQGFNRLKGEASLNELASCIDHDGSLSTLNSRGALSSFSISHLKSTSDLYHKLNRDIAHNVGFRSETLSGSNQAGVKTLDEISISLLNSYALITGKKIFSPISLTSYRVPKEILDFYSAHPDLFYKNCGDSFISSVSMGIELTAILECRANSEEEKKKIDEIIATNVNGKIFEAKLSLQNLLESTLKSSTSGCSIYVEAKSGRQVEFDISIDSFAQNAVNFITQGTIEEAVPVGYLTQDYYKVPDNDFKEHVLDKIDLNFKDQYIFSEILRKKISAGYDIIETYKSFLAGTKDQTNKQETETKIRKKLVKIEKWKRKLETLADNPKKFIENIHESWSNATWEKSTSQDW